MVQANWQDKGHFQTGFDVPLHLKIVKEDDLFSGYYRESEKDDWTLSGNKTWNHKFDVERVGIGFMNSWGGQTVTFLVDTLSIEGEGIEPLSVAPEGKLTMTWVLSKQVNNLRWIAIAIELIIHPKIGEVGKPRQRGECLVFLRVSMYFSALLMNVLSQHIVKG